MSKTQVTFLEYIYYKLITNESTASKLTVKQAILIVGNIEDAEFSKVKPCIIFGFAKLNIDLAKTILNRVHNKISFQGNEMMDLAEYNKELAELAAISAKEILFRGSHLVKFARISAKLAKTAIIKDDTL